MRILHTTITLILFKNLFNDSQFLDIFFVKKLHKKL